MTIINSIILGIVQGATEFIPVSSSGHLILARDFLGIASDTNALAFDAVIQLATILAVAVYFYRDIWDLICTAYRFVFRIPTEESKVILMKAIVVGTIPAAILGLFLEKYMDTIFRSDVLVAVTLLLGAGLMYGAEWYVERNKIQSSDLTIKKGFMVGLFQVLALIPGVSRSGSTISGGLFSGLSRATATRFSFLLSFPIITAAGLKKLFDLIKHGEVGTIGMPLIISSTVAFFVGLLAIHFLIKYLKTHTLKVFVWYRVVLAVIVLAILFLK